MSEKGSGIVEFNEIEPKEQAREQLLMGLRLSEGIRADKCSPPIDREKIAALESQGMVTLSGGMLCATPRGRLVLNSVIAALAD